MSTADKSLVNVIMVTIFSAPELPSNNFLVNFVSKILLSLCCFDKFFLSNFDTTFSSLLPPRLLDDFSTLPFILALI
ncbi:Uncharacterised protein [Chlamydia trachomatis]|nr:Uncharacterised protein [Chlamydia trachomatis]